MRRNTATEELGLKHSEVLKKYLMSACITTKLEVFVFVFTYIFTVNIVLPNPEYNNTLDYCWTTACCCVAYPKSGMKMNL